MDSHSHSAFLGNGNNLFEEFFKICPETFRTDFTVSGDKLSDFVLSVARIPAGKMYIILQRIKTFHLLPIHNKAC